MNRNHTLNPQPFRLIGQFAMAGALVFALAACGGGNASPSITASTTAPSTGTPSATVVAAQVSTVAGSGAPGSANGAGTVATFNDPASIAMGANSNLYVADTFNHAIRKIDPSGNVTTLAGSGAKGSANGLGTAASFNTPRGIAVDASGIVYVADSGNNLIRRIDASGNVTTLAGAGTQGAANGQGTAASFNGPFGVAVDANGNAYVADASNNLIRKIDASGNVTTLAGSGAQGAANGQATAASFNLPHSVVIDASGNVYVADTPNNLIRKIAPADS